MESRVKTQPNQPAFYKVLEVNRMIITHINAKIFVLRDMWQARSSADLAEFCRIAYVYYDGVCVQVKH